MLITPRSTRPRLRSNVRRLSRKKWTPNVPRSRLPVSEESRERPPSRTPSPVKRRQLKRHLKEEATHDWGVGERMMTRWEWICSWHYSTIMKSTEYLNAWCVRIRTTKPCTLHSRAGIGLTYQQDSNRLTRADLMECKRRPHGVDVMRIKRFNWC